MEFVKEVSKPDIFLFCVPQSYIPNFRYQSRHYSLLFTTLGYNYFTEEVTIVYHGFSILKVFSIATIFKFDKAK